MLKLKVQNKNTLQNTEYKYKIHNISMRLSNVQRTTSQPTELSNNSIHESLTGSKKRYQCPRSGKSKLDECDTKNDMVLNDKLAMWSRAYPHKVYNIYMTYNIQTGHI